MKRLLPFILLSAICLTGCNGNNNSSNVEVSSESTTATTTSALSTTSADTDTEATISSTTRTEKSTTTSVSSISLLRKLKANPPKRLPMPITPMKRQQPLKQSKTALNQQKQHQSLPSRPQLRRNRILRPKPQAMMNP